MSEKMPPTSKVDVDSEIKTLVIDRLRIRAEKHRRFALYYTIAVFGTIIASIATYYIFQNSKLNDLQESTQRLKEEYIEINTAIKLARAEQRTQLVETREILKDFYDSLKQQQQTADVLSTRVTQQMPKILDEIDLATIEETQRSIDTLRVHLEGNLRNIQRTESALNRYYQQMRNSIRHSFGDSVEYINLLNEFSFSYSHNIRSARQTSYQNGFNSSIYDSLLSQWNNNVIALRGRVTDLNNELARNITTFQNFQKSIINMDSLYDYNSEDYILLSSGVTRVSRKLSDQVNRLNSLSDTFESLQYLISNQTDIGPSGTLKKLDGTLRASLVQADKIQDRFDAFAKASEANSKNYNQAFGDLPTILARYGLIIFLIYVIQLLLSYAKYHYRLASFYDSKSDAIQLQTSISDISTADLIKLLDSSLVSFGRSENIYQKLYESIRDFTKSK